MIDRVWIGRTYATSTLTIEAGRLRAFATAIGDPDPIWRNADAARAAGYERIPAPPTFLFAAELDSDATFGLLRDLRVPLGRVLHGEQSFEHHAPAMVGDVITVRSTIADIYDKRDGALEFVEMRAEAHNQDDQPVATMRSVLVVRNGGAGR